MDRHGNFASTPLILTDGLGQCPTELLAGDFPVSHPPCPRFHSSKQPATACSGILDISVCFLASTFFRRGEENHDHARCCHGDCRCIDDARNCIERPMPRCQAPESHGVAAHHQHAPLKADHEAKHIVDQHGHTDGAGDGSRVQLQLSFRLHLQNGFLVRRHGRVLAARTRDYGTLEVFILTLLVQRNVFQTLEFCGLHQVGIAASLLDARKHLTKFNPPLCHHFVARIVHGAGKSHRRKFVDLEDPCNRRRTQGTQQCHCDSQAAENQPCLCIEHGCCGRVDSASQKDEQSVCWVTTGHDQANNTRIHNVRDK
mmetsp:Transcript_40437/g.93886  ORF Transcript_40437/g.93886 Transcript_40437/m.93886 type:complete len:314 (-) Transcript_40437:857-1798(-)